MYGTRGGMDRGNPNLTAEDAESAQRKTGHKAGNETGTIRSLSGVDDSSLLKRSTKAL